MVVSNQLCFVSTFLTFLMRGMRALGRRMHGALVVICLLLWGIGGFVPHVNFDLTSSSVFVMIYWFIFISYYRWYCKQLSAKQCMLMIISGLAIQFAYWLGGNMLFAFTGKGASLQIFIFDHWKLPSILIGSGIFLICESRKWSNKAVNWVAGSALGVYLISYNPLVFNSLIAKFDFDIFLHCSFQVYVLFSLRQACSLFVSC